MMMMMIVTTATVTEAAEAESVVVSRSVPLGGVSVSVLVMSCVVGISISKYCIYISCSIRRCMCTYHTEEEQTF